MPNKSPCRDKEHRLELVIQVDSSRALEHNLNSRLVIFCSAISAPFSWDDLSKLQS